MLKPRDNFLNWDEVWMGQAVLISKRSKDPKTQVGACIVDNENIPVSVGYNGFPRGIDNDALPWDRDGDFLNTKYAYVCHAEENALSNNGADRERMKKSKIYTTLFPCNNCAKQIIQKGIKEVVYLSDKYYDKNEFIAARKMFMLAGVKIRQLEINKKINIELNNKI